MNEVRINSRMNDTHFENFSLATGFFSDRFQTSLPQVSLFYPMKTADISSWCAGAVCDRTPAAPVRGVTHTHSCQLRLCQNSAA